MLPAFDIGLLLLPAAVILAVTTAAALASGCSPALSWTIACAKAGLFAIYYGFVFDGRFTFLDDWSYLGRGGALRDAGVGLTNLFDSLPLLIAAGEGNHFAYYLYNAIAFDWFGEGYYAPVALNVAASAIVAWVSTRLVVVEGLCPRQRAPLFFAFVALHPDILAWSTVMNGKDTLVLLLHVLLLTSVSMFLRGRRFSALVLAGAVTTALLFLRFYVPLMFAAALVLTATLRLHGAARARVALAAALLLGGLAWQLGVGMLSFVMETLQANLVNPVTGFVHFLLTPVPFGTDDNYAFLNLPALLHWLLLPIALLGLRRVAAQRTDFCRYLVMYALTFAALYSVYGELQGPRHRLQLDFAWATFQFLGLVIAPHVLRDLLGGLRRVRQPSASTPGAPA